MNYLGLKQRLRYQLHEHPMGTLSGLTLFSAAGFALVNSVWSVYVDSFFHNPAVTGVVTGLFSILIIVLYIFFSGALQKHDEQRTFALATAMTIIIFLLYPQIRNPWVFIGIAALGFTAMVLRRSSLTILIRDASSKKSISKNEGLKFVLSNSGWVIGPLIVALLFTGKNFTPIFMIAAAFMFVVFIGSFFLKVRHHRKQVVSPLAGFRKFWSRKRTIAYIMRTATGFFWGYIFTYVPLYIIYSGMKASIIGVVVVAAILPLVILEYFISSAAPKIGFRKIFLTGCLISGLFLTASFFTSINGMVSLSLALVVGASVGMAFLEPTVEAYFFRATRRDEEASYIGTLFTANNMGMMVAKFMGAGLLLFTALDHLAIFYGAIMLGSAFVALRVKI